MIARNSRGIVTAADGQTANCKLFKSEQRIVRVLSLKRADALEKGGKLQCNPAIGPDDRCAGPPFESRKKTRATRRAGIAKTMPNLEPTAQCNRYVPCPRAIRPHPAEQNAKLVARQLAGGNV